METECYRITGNMYIYIDSQQNDFLTSLKMRIANSQAEEPDELHQVSGTSYGLQLSLARRQSDRKGPLVIRWFIYIYLFIMCSPI